MQHRPIVQDREVEPAAVPRDEVRRVTLDPVEEPFHQLALAGLGVPEGPYPEPVSGSQDHRDRHDPVEVVAHHFRPRGLLLTLTHDLRDLGIPESVERQQPAARGDVRHGLDVEREDVHSQGFARRNGRWSNVGGDVTGARGRGAPHPRGRFVPGSSRGSHRLR